MNILFKQTEPLWLCFIFGSVIYYVVLVDMVTCRRITMEAYCCSSPQKKL